MVIPKISDVLVTLSTFHPQNSAGLNTTAIFTPGSTQSFKTYFDIQDVASDYPANSSVLNQATTLFAQEASPEAVAVVTYSNGSAQAPSPSSTVNGSSSSTSSAASTNTSSAGDSSLTGIAKAAYDYFFEAWDYAILSDYNLADAQALANVIEAGGDDGNGFHLLFLQFNASNQSDATQFAKFTRTWTYYHPIEGESIVAALTGEAGAQDTGKASWQFVSNLAGVNPVNVQSATNTTPLTATKINDLEKQGFILYVNKGTYSNFTGAANASGNYIDVFAGEDWIKANLEAGVQDALADVNGSGKTSFNADGLAKIDAAMTNVLDRGYAQGIIAADADTGKADYTLGVPRMGDVPSVSVSRRILNNVKFRYSADSEIGKVNIKGTAVA